jgi:hypothetical protein
LLSGEKSYGRWGVVVVRLMLITFSGVCGWVVRTFGPGSKDPRFESWSCLITLPPHVHQCSSTGLSKAEWCVIFLWFMHLKDPKRAGESHVSQASNSGQSLNHWTSVTPNYSDTHEWSRRRRRLESILCYTFTPCARSLTFLGIDPQVQGTVLYVSSDDNVPGFYSSNSLLADWTKDFLHGEQCC